MIPLIIIVLGSYLVGSIPSGYIAGRLGGMDIRKFGSGNIGATNVTRALGKKYGYPVFAADFCKGLIAVFGSGYVAGHVGGLTGYEELARVLGAAICVVGNAFPIWLHFRGGKGVAVSAGVLFALMPLAAIIVTTIWAVTFFWTRYISLASIVGALALPLTVLTLLHFRLMNGYLFLYVSLALTAVVVLRHRSNLSRLIQGTEHRFRKSGE